MVDPDMGTWSYAYDAQGNLTRQTDAKNQRICLYYDALNRLVGKHYRSDDTCPTANANPTLNVSYFYDATPWGIGHRTGMADVSGTTTWAYDQRGRVTSEVKTVTGGGTYTTAWTYTSADRVASMIYPKGSQTATSEIVTSNYLPQGTLTSLTSSLGPTYLSSASVDAAGRPVVFELGNGTQTVYTYNAWTAGSGQGGRMQKLQSGTSESLTAGAPSLQSFQYTYDWAGNITDITQKVGSQSVETPHYDYDEINRLTSVTYGGNPITATYDANTGNLATKASKVLGYGTQAANCPGGALTKVHAAISLDSTTNTYCYDLNGNMTRRTIGANIYTLSYDPENRMTQISGGGGPVFDYVYDGDGQRVLVKQTTGSQTDKTIYIGGYFEVFIKASYTAPTTPPAPNCGVRRCVYFPLGIVPNNPPATTGQVWKSYYSTGSGRVMRIQDNTNTGGGSGLFWLYADHLGSTTLTARLDGLGGGLISTLSYTAWGETRNSTGTTPTSIRYTGQREAEAGLYFYNARWYDSALGRFAQADTLIPGQDAQAFDRYSYAGNNPARYNDPTGHFKCVVEPTPDYTPEQCQQDVENWLNILKNQGGSDGEQMERVFRRNDFISYCENGYCVVKDNMITVRIVKELRGKNGEPISGAGFYNSETGEYSFLAAAMQDFRKSKQDTFVGVGMFAHEIKHQQQGGVWQPSVAAEVEAYTTQYHIYQALGIDQINNTWVSTSNDYGHRLSTMSPGDQVDVYSRTPYQNLSYTKIFWGKDIDNFVRWIIGAKSRREE
jgi:RHS repeat-associated protein